MERVRTDGDWSFFCPSTVPSLVEIVGEDFEDVYRRLEMGELYTARVKARVVWDEILTSIIRSGGQCIMFKDAINSGWFQTPWPPPV